MVNTVYEEEKMPGSATAPGGEPVGEAVGSGISSSAPATPAKPKRRRRRTVQVRKEAGQVGEQGPAELPEEEAGASESPPNTLALLQRCMAIPSFRRKVLTRLIEKLR